MTKRQVKRLINNINDHKNFDCRTNKNTCYIEFFTRDSSWAPLKYTIPENFSAFVNAFLGIIRDLIESSEITSASGAALDALVDSKLHIALRELNSQRAEHLHTIQEIELTKEAHIADLKSFAESLRKLRKEIAEEEKS